jgi:[protein-PII] uridylyltransferase
VLEENGSPIQEAERITELKASLWRSLRRPEQSPLAVSRRTPRQTRMFNTPTQISITTDERNRRSVIELVAGDRPGLLCDVGKVLWEQRVDLQSARISTIGERAEDVFYVTDLNHRPLDAGSGQRLQQELVAALTRAS